MPDGSPNWVHVNELIEKYWLHEFRTPILDSAPFLARFHNKPTPDSTIALYKVVGLSPQGWAAVLASKGMSSKRYLFSRHRSHPRDVPWVQVAGFEPLVAGCDPIATGIDRNTVTMLFGKSHRNDAGDVVNTYEALVVDLEAPREPPRRVALPANSPNALSISGHTDRLLVVHENGALTIMHPKTGMSYAVFPVFPVREERTLTAAAGKTNPLTGDPLDEGHDVEDDAMKQVAHPIALAVHDQCDPNKVALSTRTGWVIHAKVAPADTPPDEATRFFADNMSPRVMGCDPRINDTRFKTPSQEAGVSLCTRCAPGADDVSIAQCNQHVTFRCDAVLRVIKATDMVPRYPSYQVADVGPMNNIAMLGTVLVAHTNNNTLIIATLVPNLQDPERPSVRFRSGAKGANSLMAAPAEPYPSLCVTIGHIYWLLPDGTMVTTTPCSVQQQKEVMATK